MKKNQIIIAIIVMVAVGGISFYAGTKSSGNSGANNRSGQFMAGGFNGAGGAGGASAGMRAGRGTGTGGGNVSGEVLSKDATSITVKLRDGGSKIVFITGTTAVQKTVTGTLDDIVVGSQVTANGQANADGSVNAVMINQRPAFSGQGNGLGTSTRATQ